jgi:regulator of cell morphogenesis and NO signaling
VILLQHNPLEDEIIFPYIKQIEAAYRRKEPYGHLFVRTLRKPLAEGRKSA